MAQETIRVLMGGYLSKEAATEDFHAVETCGAETIGLVIVSKALDGTLSVDMEDHAVKKGAVKLGGAGFVVGLFAPPLLAATVVGAAIGAGVGKIAHNKVEAGVRASAEQSIPIGGAGLIVAYHPASGDAVEGAVARAIKRAVGEATESHGKALKAAMADAQAKLSAPE